MEELHYGKSNEGNDKEGLDHEAGETSVYPEVERII